MNSADTTQWADADTLQPSQFLIDQGRLDALERCFTPQQVSPIPVRRMDGRLVMLDGHHRACALLRWGADRLPIVHDEDGDVSLPLYRTCVAACWARGVLSARSLTGCIVSPQVFRRDWDSYCDELHAHEDYAADPCGSAALPMWKQRQHMPPANLRVMHARAWDALGLKERDRFDDVRRFFRLRHDLTGVPDAPLPPGCAFVPADGLDAADRARIAAFLRLCYPDTDAD